MKSHPHARRTRPRRQDVAAAGPIDWTALYGKCGEHWPHDPLIRCQEPRGTCNGVHYVFDAYTQAHYLWPTVRHEPHLRWVDPMAEVRELRAAEWLEEEF